jgi:Phenylalanyl-tRNA synthetase beta subunit
VKQVTVFEKGLDPNRTYMAIERACTLLEKYADAKIQKGTVVYDKADKKEKNIDITFDDINTILGIQVPQNETLNVFRKLGFEYKTNGNIVTVTVPTRRLDISIKEDLIEEVGRIYGADNIHGKLPVLPTKPGKYDKTTREIRNKMIGLGLNETMSYILVNEKDATKFTTDKFDLIKLLDPLTEDRNTLRYSMIPSLLKIYEYNIGRNNKDVSIFEIGKGFAKIGEEYKEEEKLCILISGKYYTGINNQKNVDFYIFKRNSRRIIRLSRIQWKI